MIKKWNLYLLTLLLLLGVTLPTTFQPAHAQLANQISGKVAAEIDPFLLLRNLARANPQAFQDVLDLLLNDNLYPIIDPLPPLIKDPILAEIEKRRQDPESFIDFLEEIVETLAEPPLNIDLRAEIAKFLVIDRDSILALIPNLPADLKNLLAGLLPQTIDLNYLPLSGATLSVQNARGWTLGLAISSQEGSYSLKLPTGATQIKVSRVGYQPLLIDLMKVKALEAATDNLALFPDMIMMTPNSANLTARVYDGLRPVNNALVSVMTATNQQAGRTNRIGVSNIKGIQPLLPGLLGGLGYHKVMVDAEGYYLAEQTPLFLASNAQLWYNLTKAPPFGTALGQVDVRRSFPEDVLSLLDDLGLSAIAAQLGIGPYTSGLGNVEVAVLDTFDSPIVDPILTNSDGGYRYDPPDTYSVPIGTWRIEFMSDIGSIFMNNILIRAARQTEVNACFSSLNGVVTTPNCILDACVPTPIAGEAVKILDPGTGDELASTVTTALNLDPLTLPGFYEIIGIPPGTYDLEVGKKKISGSVFAACEAKTESLCYSKLSGLVTGDIFNFEAPSVTIIGFTFTRRADGNFCRNFGFPIGTICLTPTADGKVCYRSACITLPEIIAPLQGATVNLLDDEGASLAIDDTDILGLYGFDKLLPGTYGIRFEKTGYTTVERDVTIGDCDNKTGENQKLAKPEN